jgi:hypothetical protein
LGSDERKRHDPTSEEIQAMERSGRWKNFSGRNQKNSEIFFRLLQVFFAAPSLAPSLLPMPP